MMHVNRVDSTPSNSEVNRQQKSTKIQIKTKKTCINFQNLFMYFIIFQVALYELKF